MYLYINVYIYYIETYNIEKKIYYDCLCHVHWKPNIFLFFVLHLRLGKIYKANNTHTHSSAAFLVEFVLPPPRKKERNKQTNKQTILNV